MNKKEQIQLLTALFNHILDIVEKKGDDYSDDSDRLSNFKRVGGTLNLKAWQVIMTFISTKQVRLVELLGENKTPKNESIKDTIFDMIGYLGLLYLLLYHDKDNKR